jgi:cell division protein FtsI (penicillin-binding protein 3)
VNNSSTQKNQKKFYRGRYFLLLLIFLGLVLALLLRVVDLTVHKQHFLLTQGNKRSLRVEKSPAFRGMITDRNGSPLAVSTPVDSVWINPKDFQSNHFDLKRISHLLGLKVKTIKKRLHHFRNRQFAYIKRGIDPAVAKKIKALSISGLYLQREYKRFYPEGEMAAHAVGFSNIDGHGQEGIELVYNKYLAGTPGKDLVLKDRVGNVVGVLEEMQEQVPGQSLALSLDNRIQYLAYKNIKEAVLKNEAAAGTIVVLDAKSSEVLAMANYPSYNPNERPKINEGEQYRNRAVTDVFEPGSTIKAFTIASALDSQKYLPDTIVHTAPGYLHVGKNWVKDEHNNEDLTVTEIIKRSSNVGVTKITLSLPPEQLYGLLTRVGFGERTLSGLPGESAGVLVRDGMKKPFALATLGFGYGVTVTPLQLAHAYAVLANNGVYVPVSILKREHAVKGKQVIDRKVANEMVQMLESVVSEGGTGSLARVAHYRVAGKTGTARVAGPNGYYKHRYNTSFVGMAPAEDPKIVIAVVLFQPEGKNYYGGVIAAPVFSKVMAGALRILLE